MIRWIIQKKESIGNYIKYYTAWRKLLNNYIDIEEFKKSVDIEIEHGYFDIERYLVSMESGKD